jgi:hypothetical protein
VRPRLYEASKWGGIRYEVATVVWAGSRGLTVTRFTGRLSLKNVVTNVLRAGSHQVTK